MSWKGTWRNQYGSTLAITDDADNRIAGVFVTALKDSAFYGADVPVSGIHRGDCISFAFAHTGPAGDVICSLSFIGLAGAPQAIAQGRDQALVTLSEEGPATLDIHAATANVPTHEVSWNVYDRPLTHARIKLPDGSFSYDYTKFESELAERWEVAPTTAR